MSKPGDKEFDDLEPRGAQHDVEARPETEIVLTSIEPLSERTKPAVASMAAMKMVAFRSEISLSPDATKEFTRQLLGQMEASTRRELALANKADKESELIEQQKQNAAEEGIGIKDRVGHEITVRRRQRRTIAILRLAGWLFVGAAVLVLSKELWDYFIHSASINVGPVAALGGLGAGMAGGASLLPTNKTS